MLTVEGEEDEATAEEEEGVLVAAEFCSPAAAEVEGAAGVSMGDEAAGIGVDREGGAGEEEGVKGGAGVGAGEGTGVLALALDTVENEPCLSREAAACTTEDFLAEGGAGPETDDAFLDA